MNEVGTRALRQDVMTNDPAPIVESEIIDLRFLLAAILQRKWWVLIFTILGLAYGLRDVRSFEPKYVIEMIIEPAAKPSAAAASGGQLNSIAKVIGIGGGGGQATSPTKQLTMSLGSLALASRLQERYGLFHEIFKGGWDVENQRWIAPSGWRFELRQEVNRFLRLGTWAEPSIESLAQFIGSTIKIKRLHNTSARRLRLFHQDAKFGRSLLTKVIKEADRLLRDRDIIATRNDRAYLKKRLEIEANSNSRFVLLSMLEQQEQAGMLLDREGFYVVRIIEPAHVLRRKTEPNILIILVVPGIIGFFLAIIGICMIALFRSE